MPSPALSIKQKAFSDTSERAFFLSVKNKSIEYCVLLLIQFYSKDTSPENVLLARSVPFGFIHFPFQGKPAKALT
jgi:hypothetical protein